VWCCPFEPSTASMLKLNVSHRFIIITLSLACFLHNILINGTNNVISSSLQREFIMSSHETGIYVSLYDIGSLVSSLVIPFASSARGSKPQWISFGMIMLFTGSMICISPHFLRSAQSTGSVLFSSKEKSIELCNKTVYQEVGENGPLLSSNSSENELKPTTSSKSTGLSRLFQIKNLLYMGNLVNGFSSSSMTTITFSYIEDIAPTSLSAVYESAYYTSGAFGVIFKNLFYASNNQ
jgi:MFS family permease